jgi:hypothetical protein
MCWRPLYAKQTQKNRNKTWTPLQTNEGKERTKIRFYAEIVTDIKQETQNVKTHNRTTQKTKKMSNKKAG